MAAVARCLAGERRDALLIQTIDSDINELPGAEFLAQSLVRMHVSEQWKYLSTPYEPLWSLEREVYLRQGKIQIERFGPSASLDSRYNSDRREIKQSLPLDATTVALCRKGAAYQLTEVFETVAQKEADKAVGIVTVKVKKSLLTAVKVKSIGCVYLVAGEDAKTGESVLAFCETLKSSISVPKAWTLVHGVSAEQEADLLLAAAEFLVSEAVFGKAAGSVLVHEAPARLARSLAQIAVERKVSAVFTTTTSDDPLFHYVHPSTAATLVAESIPADLSTFVNFSTKAADSDTVGTCIKGALPASCKRKDGTALLSNEAFVRSGLTSNNVSETLRHCYTASIARLPSSEHVDSLSLDDIPDRSAKIEELRVLDWTTSTTALVSATLVNKDLKFRADKTYWMIGATGEIGLSTCQWMIQRGARYFVLTSRNPKVDQVWLKTMESKGATIKIMSM
jgi:hypothetical protein